MQIGVVAHASLLLERCSKTDDDIHATRKLCHPRIVEAFYRIMSEAFTVKDEGQELSITSP